MVRDTAHCVDSNAGQHQALALASAVRALSSSLANPVDFDGCILEALQSISRLYGPTRARLFRVRTDAQAPVKTHEWCVAGIVSTSGGPGERHHEYFRLRSAGIAETRPQGQLLRVSDELCSLLGYPRSELLSLTLQALLHPQDLAAHQAEYDRMLRGEVQSYSTRTRLLRKDRVPLLASLWVTGRCETSGEIMEVVVS